MARGCLEVFGLSLIIELWAMLLGCCLYLWVIVSVVGFSLVPPLRSLEHFLQHKGKEPALREGEGHLVVIAKMVVDDKTTYQTKRDIRDRNPRARHNG